MRSPSRRRGVPALLAVLLSPYAVAQQPAPDPQALDLRYTGATARIGIGYDTQNKLTGDAFWVFSETERTAWIAELWYSDRDAGGLKASYHWQPAGAPDAGVRKLFAAVDQNQWRDRKVTLGGGYELPEWFASGYASAGVTGRRLVSSSETTSTATTSGTDDTGQYQQDIFTTVTTREYDRAWNWGIGGRIGRFYDNVLVRLDGGLDYERGDGGADQATVSVGVTKYFPGSPISLSLVGQAYWTHGDAMPQTSGQRLLAMVRYEFGGPAWRPARVVRKVPVEVPPPAPTAAQTSPPPPPPPPVVEKRMVKTTATAGADAFFEFDRATVRPEADAALDKAIARIKAQGFEGNIRISGHTCDIGTAEYNLKLSQRRADAVKAYLVAAGVPADRILAEGMGEANPRYPNTVEGRPKNRRVDIEFVTFETKTVDVAVPPAPPPAPVAVAAAPAKPVVEWREEEIATEPTWLRRALHNPADHKRQVDVYRTREVTTATSEGPRVYTNHPPVAVADAYTVLRNSTTAFDVLANDHDPDGNPLAIVATSAPAHGTATIGAGRISYSPAAGYVGTDTFTYTIDDGKGLTASAVVTVTVQALNHPPVAVADSAYVYFNTPKDIDVLANDSDPDGDALTIASFARPLFGTVALSDHNTLVYTPPNGYFGRDQFTYTISDGHGGTATAQVLVWVDP
ncbi:MAG: tandem-95 repeat protein [Proteobacteria bacterium]|nr:tandem-95 repeat protein [Pseudomonadota bacterium]